jgi:hypothetical protein
VTIEEDPLSPMRQRQFVTENIYHCLAACTDCTGRYVSEILGMRLICCCYCHMKIKDLVGLSHSVKVDQNNDQAITHYLNEMDKEKSKLQGASQVGSPRKRQAEPEEPSPGITQEVPEL